MDRLRTGHKLSERFYMTFSVQGFLDTSPDLIPEMETSAQPQKLELPEVIYQTVLQALEINNEWRHMKQALFTPEKFSKEEKNKLHKACRDRVKDFYETFDGVKNASLKGLAYYHFFNALEMFGDDIIDGEGEDIKLWKRTDAQVTEDACDSQ